MPSKILNVDAQNYVPFEAETSPNEHLGGACVARMTLNTHKTNPTAPAVPDAATLANQQSMYATLRPKNAAGEPDTWYVDPEAMRFVLNDLDQGPRIYVEYSYTDRNALNAKLIYTIDTYEIPPAVLTGDGSYWVAVVGYATDAANALLGFYLHDPSWDASLPGFTLVSATTWNGAYLRIPVRASSPRWGGKFVSVCDPEPQSADVGAPERRVKRPGDRIIPPDEVEGLIREALEEQELIEQPEVRSAVERGRPSRPQLIQLLDDVDAPYYLVTYQPDGGARDQTIAKAALDARYGDLMCFCAAPEPWTSQLRSRAQILRAVVDRPIQVPRPLSELRAELVEELAGREELSLEPAPLRRVRRAAAIDAALVSARRPTETVVLRQETTEISTMLVATTAMPATLLSPSYRVTSGGITMYMRAYASSVEMIARLPRDFDDPWFPEVTPLGG